MHVGTGGLQAHSCGPLMPVMIRGVGNTLQAFHGETGKEGVRHPYNDAESGPGSFHDAHDKAEAEARQWLAGS